MENLDWDSLAFIFSFFGFKERVQLERVCKKWRDVMQVSPILLQKRNKYSRNTVYIWTKKNLT